MLKHVYAIRDAKSQCYTQLLFQLTHGEAERSFTGLVRNKDTVMNQFPEDYDLYYLGTFDDNSGIHTSLDTPQHIQKAVNLISL